MVIEYVLAGVLTLFGAAMTILLGLILSRLNRVDNKLDEKMDKADCVKQQATCKELFGTCDFWDQFGRHSHTGLASDSKVTR